MRQFRPAPAHLSRALLAWSLLGAGAALATPNLDFDLRANAPLAHVYRDGVVADAATVGFVKYLRDLNGRWKRGAKIGGRPASQPPGVQANLWLPVGPELAGQKLVLEAMIFPHGKDQRVDPFVNDKKAGNATVEDERWQVLRVELEPGLVEPGLNKVRLHFRRSTDVAGHKTAVSVRYVRFTRADATPLPEDEAALARALAVTDGDALLLPDGGGLDWYVLPPKGSKVVGAAAGGTVEVLAHGEGGQPKRLGGGASADAALGALAGKPVRLMLRGKGDAKLSGARIAGATAGPPLTLTKPKYVVFWMVDTLRADKLGFYPRPNANGRPKVKTPNYDRITKEGVVFDPFWVTGNESKASHASVFTAVYPAVHKVINHEAKLPDKLTTIAEALKKAGYRTGAFVSNGYVSDRWNFVQGFDENTNFIREEKANNAKAVVNAAISWIDKNKDTPFYLYLGTADPHVTYRAHDEFIGEYDKGAYGGPYKKYLSGTELGRIKGQKNPPSARDRQRIEALYENEIAFNDLHFGRLLDHLQTLGIYDDTLIILTSDHGDEFWEHGSCGHGQSLYEELVSVPMVMRYPKSYPAGQRVETGGDGVDFLPTLLRLVGGTPAKESQGLDLTPYIGAKGAWPVAKIATMGLSSYALKVGGAKLIMRGEASIQAFDIDNDPSELKDVFPRHYVLSLAALDPLSIYLTDPAGWNRQTYGPPNNLTRAFK